MSRCIIISGGNLLKKDLEIIKNDDFIICADSGYKYAIKYNLKVNLLVGDFDSLKKVPINLEIVKLNKIKDDTDTFSSLKEGIKRNFKEFILLGALGKREEHSLANISILIYLKNRNLDGIIYYKKRIYKIIKNEEIKINRKKGYISIFSISEKSEGIYLKNLKYELSNHVLKSEFALGIDNEFINKEALVKVENGTLLLIY